MALPRSCKSGSCDVFFQAVIPGCFYIGHTTTHSGSIACRRVVFPKHFCLPCFFCIPFTCLLISWESILIGLLCYEPSLVPCQPFVSLSAHINLTVAFSVSLQLLSTIKQLSSSSLIMTHCYPRDRALRAFVSDSLECEKQFPKFSPGCVVFLFLFWFCFFFSDSVIWVLMRMHCSFLLKFTESLCFLVTDSAKREE